MGGALWDRGFNWVKYGTVTVLHGYVVSSFFFYSGSEKCTAIRLYLNAINVGSS